MPRKFYSSKYAHDEYRSVLVDCRVGINQTPESIQAMNDLLVPLIKEKHQSIGHIYATHAEELGCSRRTLYSYISNCVFEVRNSDLSNAQSGWRVLLSVSTWDSSVSFPNSSDSWWLP